MTKQDLINRSLSEIDKLKNDNDIDTSELDFYKEFVSKYSPFSNDMIKNMSYSDYFKAIINVVIHDIPFSKINEDVDKFGSLLDNMDVEGIVVLADVLKAISKRNMDDKIIESIKDSNKRRGIRSIKELFSLKEDDVLATYFDVIIRENKDGSVLPLLELNKNHPEFIIGMLGSIAAMKCLVENEQNINMQLEMVRKNGYKMSAKEKNRQLDKIYKDAFLTDQLRYCFADINNYYTELEKKDKKASRDKAKTIRAYEDFVNNLTRVFNNDEITNYESIIKKIPDEELRLEFLKLVYQHNNVSYENLQSTYNELSKNSTVHFLALLKKYDISKDEVDLSKVMKNDYDVVEELLRLLSDISNDKDFIIKTIQITDIDTCNYIKSLKAKGVLSVNTLKKYSNVFDSSSSIFYTLNENIKTLGIYTINPAVFVNNANVLLECNLADKLAILDSYNLIKSMKNNGDYSYLIRDDLVSLIDKIIELGYENFLVNDLTLLNEDNWDRLYVLKSIGEEVDSKSRLLEVLRDNSFLVPNSKIDKYIANIVPYYQYKDNIDITSLNGFNGSERSYNINGIIVSKNRFKRNYEKNENAPILKNLVDGGVYSIEEVKQLEKTLLESKQK